MNTIQSAIRALFGSDRVGFWSAAAPAAAAEPAAAEARSVEIAWVVAISLIAGLAAALYGGGSAGDDTFIYMRYVENALHGKGFTYNPGETSYGITSFLWTLAVTPLAVVFGNVVSTWKAATVVLTAARAGLLTALVRRLGAPRWLAVVLVAVAILEPHTFRWASSGMEGALALLALTALAWMHCVPTPGRTRAALLGCLLGALPFIRPELGLFSVGVGLMALRDRPADRAVIVVCAAIVAGACLATTAVFMGGIFPDTAAAKALFQRQPSPTYGVLACAKILLSGAGGALAIVVLLPRDRTPASSWRGLTLLAVAGAMAYLAQRNQLVSTRYATYLSGPIVLAATLLVAQVRSRGKLAPVARAALGLQLLASSAILTYFFPVTRVTEIADVRAFNAEIQGELPAGARVALSEIGIYGYYSNRYIIDLFGLVDPAVLRWARAHGRPRSVEAMEDLLISRGATHYIDAFAEKAPIQGHRLRFTPVREHLVMRDNFSLGVLLPSLWRLYRLDPVEGAPAAVPSK